MQPTECFIYFKNTLFWWQMEICLIKSWEVVPWNKGHRIQILLDCSFNPIALTKAKIVYNFGLSECNRVKRYGYSAIFFCPCTKRSSLTHCILVDSSTDICWMSPFVILRCWIYFVAVFYFWWKILFANNVDPDQMPHYVASDLGLHCLPVTLLRVSR